MEITKALCLSTAHIKPETAKWLDGGSLPFTVWRSDYGWFMYAGPDRDREGFPADLSACLDAAAEAECDFLRLDGDGPEVDGLETFEWA
jgi:hypothetical protein